MRARFLLLTIILSVGCFRSDRSQGDRPREPWSGSGGTLATIEGIPLLRVHGTPVEMGEQTGRLCRDQVRRLIDHYLTPFLGKRRTEALKAARRMEQHIPAAYIDEMKSLAAAAGVAYDDILLANATVEIYQLSMCSALVLRGSLTREGSLLFGRNLDFPTLGVLEHSSIVVEYRPNDGRCFISVTWPGLVGVLSGMNDRGLAVANLVAFGQEKSLDGVPHMFLLRQVLERETTVAGATELARKARRTTGNSYLAADAARDAAVLEVNHESVVVRPISDDRLFATNNFVPAGRETATCPRFVRLSRAAREIERPVGVPEVAAMLGKVNLGALTVQSMIFIPEKRELHLAVGGTPATAMPYIRMKFR